jgi:hypothetical protein
VGTRTGLVLAFPPSTGQSIAFTADFVTRDSPRLAIEFGHLAVVNNAVPKAFVARIVYLETGAKKT